MLKRSGSGSKRQLKEKIVQIYEEQIFGGEELVADDPNFWDEFFLLKPKQLNTVINKLTPEQLKGMKENINTLVFQCIEMLGQEHPLRLVNALQTLCAVLISMYQRHQECNLNFIAILIGEENVNMKMQKLLEHCNHILSGDFPDSIKSIVLNLILVIVTGMDSIDDNPMIEYLMTHCIFKSLVQLLCTNTERQQHGYNVVMILMFLASYKKQETANPYVVKLSILDDELALNGYGQVITATLNDYVLYTFGRIQGNNNGGGGWLSSLTSMVGGIFLANDDTQPVRGSEEGMLLALYEASHLNRNFMTTLAHSSSTTSSAPPSPPATLPPHQSPPNEAQIDALALYNDQPTNLLVTFFRHCSKVMADVRSDEVSVNKCKLCFITLTCITEEPFANSIMHDQNLSFKVQLYKQPMRHRKIAPKEPPSQPLASTLIDLLVEFMICNLRREFPGELYALCVGVLQRLLSYQNRCRIRLSRDWKPLWETLVAVINFIVEHEQTILKRHNIFVFSQQIVNIFNLFITLGDTFLAALGCYDQLYYELIRNGSVFDKLFTLAFRYSTGDGEYKADALGLANCLVNIKAIRQHFTAKIENEAKEGTLTEDQILEVIRQNYDGLILKLQDGLETYEQYSEVPYRPVLAKLRLNTLAATRQQIKRLTSLDQEKK